MYPVRRDLNKVYTHVTKEMTRVPLRYLRLELSLPSYTVPEGGTTLYMALLDTRKTLHELPCITSGNLEPCAVLSNLLYKMMSATCYGLMEEDGR